MKTSELLTKTAQTLKERGHTKFCLERVGVDGRPGAVCLMGAMNLALRSNSAYPEPYPEVYENAVKRLLTVTEARQHTGPISTMVHWNNETERTPAEVIQAVEAAAAAALADGD